MAFRYEIDSPPVASAGTPDARAFALALYRVSARCEYPQDGLIQDILAKSFIHLTRGEITDVSRKTSLNAIQNVGWFFGAQLHERWAESPNVINHNFFQVGLGLASRGSL